MYNLYKIIKTAFHLLFDFSITDHSFILIRNILKFLVSSFFNNNLKRSKLKQCVAQCNTVILKFINS